MVFLVYKNLVSIFKFLLYYFVILVTCPTIKLLFSNILEFWRGLSHCQIDESPT